MNYAIVDIETTGGYSGSGRITEIAILIFDGEKVVDRFESLVNPEADIPPYITGLTGISQQMVENAPTFSELADEINDYLKDSIFVAHNVSFDYSFIKKELEVAGYSFNPKRLCTVRLSRAIFKGHKSYSLGNLCEQLDIQIENRHRAMGDAEATAVLFEMLLKSNPDFVSSALKRNSKEKTLPPNLSKDVYEALPEEAGVYYFHDNHGNVIYVGKAINIKKRITGHFSGTSKNKRNQAIRNEIHNISYELSGNELIALLLESQEIKRLWPKYNRSQKVKTEAWALYRYEDMDGYVRFNIGKKVKGITPVLGFHTHAEAWQFLLDLVKEFKLCPKLSGIQKSASACYDFPQGQCLGACDGQEMAGSYNGRVNEALQKFTNTGRSFGILGTGRHREECSIILVEKGTYQGFGYFSVDEQLTSIDEVKPVVKKYQTTAEIDNYILNYLATNDAHVIEFST